MVSVILPNYNHALYLKQRIDSILNQSFQDFELIILDDCSNDNSKDLILEFATVDSRIKTIFNKINSGSVFKQWQKGLNFAKGKYIWIAESDDFAEPSFLETLVYMLENDISLTLAYSDSTIVDESNNIVGKFADIKKGIFNSDHWYQDFIVDGREELQQYLSLQCTINNASAALFRRSSIDAIGGIDTSFRYAGDWFTYIKLSLQGRLAYTAKQLNNYREHTANASKTSFGNNGQRYERQKCYAFIYQSKVLDQKALAAMVKQARVEFFDMQYQIMKEERQFLRMLRMIADLSKISLGYHMRIQGETFKMTKSWQRMRNRI